jgi:hypothetical protein
MKVLLRFIGVIGLAAPAGPLGWLLWLLYTGVLSEPCAYRLTVAGLVALLVGVTSFLADSLMGAVGNSGARVKHGAWASTHGDADRMQPAK